MMDLADDDPPEQTTGLPAKASLSRENVSLQIKISQYRCLLYSVGQVY